MTSTEQKSAAKAFSEYWKDKGNEKQETARFWIELLGSVLGVENPTSVIEFEKPVIVEKNQKYIDGYIPSSKILIEQKGSNISLRRTATQSDGEKLTPYGQAFRYNNYLPYEEKAKWIIVSNFTEILIYNMNKPNAEPEQIFLKDLHKEYYRLQFIVDKDDEHIKKEMEVSLQAGELVGKLYNAILKQYKNPDDPESLKSLNMLCVRLVFCLYAEDAGIFGKHGMFHDYLRQFEAKSARKALIELFQVLDQKDSERDPYLDEDLAAFPYVNGGLFDNENIEIPNFTEEIMDVLLEKASTDFDWSEISPTIFGAVFESTLNPETRRSGGMHYTSIENIHKVIDPLFLDELRAEFEDIKAAKQANVREKRLKEFQTKLSELKFLDPACGSGNFLTETYISLRKLENEILIEIYKGQMMFGDGDLNPIQVSIGQFYGIEINDFAVTVAKTALWIAESQMMKETEEIVQMSLDFLPLKSYANIVEGNALRVDWESVVPKAELNFIMGNPPFVGHRLRSKAQADDMDIMADVPKYGKIDYVGAWYYKACNSMQNTTIACAFVSTNSITQGESVGTLWKYLAEKNCEIQFAYTTFNWDSEASIKANVHCVIIGFTCFSVETSKRIYDGGQVKLSNHINAYLQAAPDVFLPSRGSVITKEMPKMTKGNEATDGGNLSLTEEEYLEIIKRYPVAKKFIKTYVGSSEFINNKKRYCIWLKGVSPNEYRNIPPITERIEKVRLFRANNVTKAVHKLADYPTLFAQIRQPETDFLLLPIVSSQRRRYIPMGFMSKDIIVNPKVLVVPDANLYLFGVLESNVHMAWMRVVTGRLKSDYEYYPSVYNNFPWCNPTDEQKAKIEQTAQAILDARAFYPDCSLADLYDELAMPAELRKAHHQNDFAVMAAYGFDRKITESECVAELMRRYREMTEGS